MLASKIIGLKVNTKSGFFLGKVSDLKFNPDNFQLSAIKVSPKGMVKKLTGEDLLIGIEHIIEINEVEVVVEDAASKSGGSRVGIEEAMPRMSQNPTMSTRE